MDYLLVDCGFTSFSWRFPSRERETPFCFGPPGAEEFRLLLPVVFALVFAVTILVSALSCVFFFTNWTTFFHVTSCVCSAFGSTKLRMNKTCCKRRLVLYFYQIICQTTYFILCIFCCSCRVRALIFAGIKKGRFSSCTTHFRILFLPLKAWNWWSEKLFSNEQTFLCLIMPTIFQQDSERSKCVPPCV